MEHINVKKFGLAWGVTSALLYLGCVFLMLVVGKQGTIVFFNALMHGIDVTTILRTDMPFWEMILGIVEILILGWLIGATIASIYNLGRTRTK